MFRCTCYDSDIVPEYGTTDDDEYVRDLINTHSPLPNAVCCRLLSL